MAGNKQFIEQVKYQKALVRKNIEEIYSGLCVVLHYRGMSNDEIAEIVNELQLKWEEIANTPGLNMADLCEQLTGIDIREI